MMTRRGVGCFPSCHYAILKCANGRRQVLMNSRVRNREMVWHRRLQGRRLLQRERSAHGRLLASFNEKGGNDSQNRWRDDKLDDTSIVWSMKPPWCQPWTIITTGLTLISVPTPLVSSLIHRTTYWPSVFMMIPVLAWWWIFLYVYPKQVLAMLQQDAELSMREGRDRKPLWDREE